MAAPAGLIPLLIAGGAAATVATVAIVRSKGGDGDSATAAGLPVEASPDGGLLGGFGDGGAAGLGLTEPPTLPAAGLDAFGESPLSVPDLPATVRPRVKLDLTPAAERQLLRDSRKRVRNSNIDTAANVAILGGIAAPAARRLWRSMPLQRAIRLSPAASRIAAGARLLTPPAAGLTAGVLTVRGLDKVGALDATANAGQRIGRAARRSTAGRAAVEVVRNVALPTTTVGAVVTAAAGRGSVRGNLRDAYRGTVVQRGFTGARRALGKVL